MIGCAGARALLEAWVDGELVGDDRAALENHLRACAACRALAQEEQQLAERLREAMPRVAAPAQLRARVAAQGAPRRRRAFAFGAVAAALVAVVAGFVAVARAPRATGPDLARLAADTHLRYGRGQLPLEVRSARADDVSGFFKGRVPFDLVLPEYPAPDGDAKPYVLEGGRLVGLQGDYAAYVAYRLDGHPISLLVASSDQARPEGGDVVAAGALRFHVVSRAGLNVITWTDHGLTYALASDVTVDGARSCLVCHGTAAERRRLEGFKVPRT